MSNVAYPFGEPTEGAGEEPDQAVIDNLERLLGMAKAGKLRSFMGTGFTSEGMRMTVLVTDPDVSKSLGALAWMQHEYVARITGQISDG